MSEAEIATKAHAMAQSDLAKTMDEAKANAAKEQAKIELLYKATQDHTRALKDRKKAADELKAMYPGYFKNLSTEEILAGKAANAYDRLKNAILGAAMARAAEAKLEKNAADIIGYQQGIDKNQKYLNRNKDTYKTKKTQLDLATGANNQLAGGVQTPTAGMASFGGLLMKRFDMAGMGIVKDYEEVQGRTSKLVTLVKARQEENEKLIDIIKKYKGDEETTTPNIGNTGGGGSGGGKNNKKDYSAALQEVKRQAQELREAYNDAMNAFADNVKDMNEKTNESISENSIGMMKEGHEKELAQINKDEEDKREEIQKEAEKTAELLGKLLYAQWKLTHQKGTWEQYSEQGEKARYNEWKKANPNATEEDYRKQNPYKFGTKEDLNKVVTDTSVNPKDISDNANIQALILKGQTAFHGQMLSDQEMFNFKRQKLTDDEKQRQLNAWNDYYKSFGTITQKINALYDEYQKTVKDPNATDGEKATAKANYEKGMKEVIEQPFDESQIQSIADRFSNAGLGAIANIKAALQDLLDYMNGKAEDVPDLFADNEKTVESIKQALSDPNATAQYKKQLQGLITQFTKMQKESNPFANLSKGFKGMFKKGGGDSQSLAKGFGQIAQYTEQAQSLMSDFGVKSDSKVGKAMSVVGKTSSMAATGASIGGPWGAVIGGALGLASGLVGNLGADYTAYNKAKEEYLSLSKVWDELISKKKEYLSQSWGEEAKQTLDEIQRLEALKDESARRMGLERLNSGASAGSHSIGVRMVQSLGFEDYRQIQNALGADLANKVTSGRMEGLFDLTGEQMEKLKEEASTFWAKMDGDVRDYMQTIIDTSDNVSKAVEQAKERMTGISFDSFEDSYTQLLQSLDADNRDFADKFEKYLDNAIMKNLVEGKYKDRIQALYDAFAKSNEDGQITVGEAEALRKQSEQLSDDIAASMEQWKEAFGMTAEQGGASTNNTVKANITESQADFIGAQLMGCNASLNAVNTKVSSLITINMQGFSQMAMLQKSSNDFLADILKYTKNTNAAVNDNLPAIKQYMNRI